MRGRCRRRSCKDCVPNAFDIAQHLVPETQNAITMVGEPSITHDVASAIGVLAGIDLDDEPFLSTNKIDDITPNWLLTHKFESAERPRTEVSPKLLFGAR